MKTYALLTEQYQRANGLKKVQVKNQLGELVSQLKSDKDIKAMRARGVHIVSVE
jgi:hypothetical protein